MKLTDIFKKKVANVEEAEKGLQAKREELTKVQSELQEKQTQKGQVAQAIQVVSAHLVIDPRDADSKKKKEKAESTLQSLTKDINDLSQKQAELQAQIAEAQKVVGQSKGEVFKQEHIKAGIAFKTLNKVKKELEAVKLPAKPSDKWEKWAREYGYPVRKERQFIPMYGTYSNSTQEVIVNREEVIPVLKEHKAEVERVSEEKAQEISVKVMEYAKKLLKEEGIELN